MVSDLQNYVPALYICEKTRDMATSPAAGLRFDFCHFWFNAQNRTETGEMSSGLTKRETSFKTFLSL